MMASLIEKLDALKICDENKRKDLYGYLYRTKGTKNYFLCSNNYFVIPSTDNKKMLLCQKTVSGAFFCFSCEHYSALKTKGGLEMKPECIHIQLCKILFSNSEGGKEKTILDGVEELENGKRYLALVHPDREEEDRVPGIITLTSRTTKPKCFTCEGKKCLHLNIYLNAAKNSTDNILPTKKLYKIRETQENPFDPNLKKGKDSNVFQVKINYPPSNTEKAEIDRINNVERLFSKNFVIPSPNLALQLVKVLRFSFTTLKKRTILEIPL